MAHVSRLFISTRREEFCGDVSLVICALSGHLVVSKCVEDLNNLKKYFNLELIRLVQN